jgi:hypothetical protein
MAKRIEYSFSFFVIAKFYDLLPNPSFDFEEAKEVARAMNILEKDLINNLIPYMIQEGFIKEVLPELYQKTFSYQNQIFPYHLSQN